MAGEELGTQFVPLERPIKGKKKWIAHGPSAAGKIFLGPSPVTASVLR